MDSVTTGTYFPDEDEVYSVFIEDKAFEIIVCIVYLPQCVQPLNHIEMNDWKVFFVFVPHLWSSYLSYIMNSKLCHWKLQQTTWKMAYKIWIIMQNH